MVLHIYSMPIFLVIFLNQTPSFCFFRRQKKLFISMKCWNSAETTVKFYWNCVLVEIMSNSYRHIIIHCSAHTIGLAQLYQQIDKIRSINKRYSMKFMQRLKPLCMNRIDFNNIATANSVSSHWIIYREAIWLGVNNKIVGNLHKDNLFVSCHVEWKILHAITNDVIFKKNISGDLFWFETNGNVQWFQCVTLSMSWFQIREFSNYCNFHSLVHFSLAFFLKKNVIKSRATKVSKSQPASIPHWNNDTVICSQITAPTPRSFFLSTHFRWVTFSAFACEWFS